MGQSLNLTIRLRNDASANWTKANPILQAGEPGVEIDTLKFKIGNGTTSWNQLPYISGGSDIIASSGGILIVDTLPEIGDESIFYKINSSQKLYYWNNTNNEFIEVGFIEEQEPPKIIDNFFVGYSVANFPLSGSDNILYKAADTQKIYYWNSIDNSYKTIDSEIVFPEDKDTNNILIVESYRDLPKTGSDIIIYKTSDDQKLYYWNSIDNRYQEFINPDLIDTNTDNIVLIENELPETGEDNKLYKILSTQKLYIWNSSENKFNLLIPEVEEQAVITTVDVLPDVGNSSKLYKVSGTQILFYWDDAQEIWIEVGASTPQFAVLSTRATTLEDYDKLPEVGNDTDIYKVLDTQTFYYWNSIEEAFKPLVSIPEVKSNVQTVSDLETLYTLQGDSEILYKVLSNEKVYTWNESTTEYVELGTGSESAIEGGSSIIIAETVEDLRQMEGKENILYRVQKDQKFYAWNSLTNMFEPMASGGSSSGEEGFKMTLVSYTDAIFAITKNERAILKYGYSSINENGIKDGVGIGTLNVNNVKKATIAVNQGDNEFDITEHLSLGENTVQLIVMNTEGKQKPLVFSIELADLQLQCDASTMQIQRAEIPLSFKVIGSGEKTIHIQIDNEDPIVSNLQPNQSVFSYTIPMQKNGDHILTAYLEREINGLTIPSNKIKIGFISVDDIMVDTAILSIFEETESQQGEVVTIPYQVYNPLQQTSDVILTIYDEEGNEYFQYERTVTRDLTYWTIQNFPAGNVTFEIRAISNSGVDAYKRFPMTIAPSVFDLEVIKDNLQLEFSAEGRSNDEKDPEHWSFEDYEATFERFAWSNSDGWIESESGETALRFLPGNKMHIPFKPFETDKRSTGYTIELELASRDVTDYDAVILSCMNENRGLEVKSQQATFKSALSEVTMQYKEDERVRITIVIEPLTLTRMMYIFINGVICSVSQYPENDSFKQNTPAEITIGSDKCGIDLYRLRFYNRVFSFNEQLNNFICDRSTNAERFDAKKRNAIFDLAGNITLNSLPPEIPYLVMQCEELPQFKGDKKKGKTVYFVDQLTPERSFSATNVQFDVQGTSSAGYPIKNFKVKFNDGIILPNGETAVGYPILEGHLPSKCLCLKADFASSEQANNVMLVEYYERLIKDYFKTPPQEEDSRVRTGIAGRPIVVFWENTTTGEVHFWGQYNMNNDKSNENVFGFDRDKYPNLECWEFSNNTSNRCLFIESEYEEIIYDEKKKEEYPAWTADFEARFPDLDDPYRDYTQFKRLTDWIVSTRQDAATEEPLDPVVTYGDKTYDKDTAEYRLAKFKNEFNDYFYKDPVIFYYLFTETFLMIDSRAKNMFLTTFDGQHWFPIPYDMDTAIGINNEGKLVFEYDLEDTDYVRGSKVFNGQDSTLWINVRDAFTSDLFEMYHDLRTNSSNPFSYETINNLMVKHQEECWPEAIWNADAKKKYVDVFLETGNDYLAMCQGSKKTQREWWLFNAFKYRDSKYRTGDAVLNSAYCRIYAPADMTVVPYQHLWPRVDFTDSYPVTKRAKRNEEVILEYPQDTANNTEIYMRSADRMVSFGDLSPYMADEIKFAPATKLQEVILGSSAPGYQNEKLIDISLGSNRLVKYLNIENCIKYGTGVQKTLDLKNCVNLETIKAFNTVPTSIAFPVGGHLKELYLPGTLKELTLQKQHMIEHFEMQSYANLESLWIEDTPGLPIEDILLNTPSLNRIRLTNISWRVSSEENLRTIFDKIKSIDGIDVDNSPLPGNPIITGYIEIDSIEDSFLEEINDLFPELILIVNGKTRFFLRYVDWDSKLLYKQPVSQGDNAIDPIKIGKIPTPTREGKEDVKYEFSQWADLPQNVQYPQAIGAMYHTEYRVQFLDGDNKVLNTQWIVEGRDALDPIENLLIIAKPTKKSTIENDFLFNGTWDKAWTNVKEPLNITAQFDSSLRKYKVYFYNDSTLLETHEVEYGTCPTYEGEADEIQKIIGGVPSEYYEFARWEPSISEGIVGETIYKAHFAFNGYIEDTWFDIAANVQNGQLEKYGYGGKKKMTISYVSKGVTYNDEVDFEIIDKNHDILQYEDPSYNNNTGKAGLTFRGLLSAKRYMNEGTYPPVAPGGISDVNTSNNGGWERSELRKWLNEDFIAYLPNELSSNIKTVKKISDNGYSDPAGLLTTSYDKIFIASLEELNLPDKNYTDLGQGTPYTLITDDSSRKVSQIYWTRSTYISGVHSFCTIPADSSTASIGSSSGQQSMMIYFCI